MRNSHWVTGDGPAVGDTPPRPSLTERAQTLCDLGRFPDAAAAAGQAIAQDPRSTDAWCLMAQAQLGQDRAAAALVAAQAACRLRPEAEASHRLVSLALGALGRAEEAAAAATEATQWAPNSWRAHVRLAHCLAAIRDRLPDARRAAQRALELEPDEAGPHLAVGRVALAAGQRTEATSAFCAALGVDPQCAEAHSELSALQNGDGRSRRSWPRFRPPSLRFRRRGGWPGQR
jgi:tetratricopeptide (TPR) repeat protein